MPVLEKIKAVEAEVEMMKLQAEEEAKKLLDTTLENATNKANKMLKDVTITIEKNNTEAKSIIEKRRQEILTSCETENEKTRKIAKEKTSIAAEAIMKKVLSV